MSRHSVLLTTDGTYPCYKGGVSVWCDQLVRQLPDVDFRVFAIGYSPSDKPVFPMPENVVETQLLSLWGTEEPGPAQANFSTKLLRRLNTTPEQIQSDFIDPFESMLRCVMEGGHPERMAEALLQFRRYFAANDYARTMSSREVWEVFLKVCRQRPEPFTLAEAMRCIRWLQRYLAVTAADIPETDIVHASMAGLAGVPGVLNKLEYGSSFLITEHGIYLRELYLSLGRMRESTGCRRFLYAFFDSIARMNYHYADSVSSLCEFNRQWQIRMGAKAERIQIIPNGVDPTLFYPKPDVEERPAPVVLTMARIYSLKGIEHLIRAARLVLDVEPNVIFRILGEVGDREYHAYCLKLVEEFGIAKSIEWGQTSNPAPAYQQADIFCLPSISEAMPFSVLEAMFSGCPVVATNVGGVAEMLGNTGLVVAPRRPGDMARALLSFLSGDGAKAFRRDLASKARLRASSFYTIEKCSERFRETYERLSATTRTASLFEA
jgi:glycosyltransferase involved in cell wall biosynthesis